MRGTSRTNTVDLSGGINYQGAPYILEQNQARDARNVRTTSTGYLTKRNGFVSVTASVGDTLTSLFPANVATPILIGAGGTKLYSVSTAGTVATLKTGLTSALPWNFVQAPTSGGQGPIYGMNGTDTPQYWDGSSGSTGDWTASTGSIPNGKYLAYFGTRIWAAGVAAQPSRLYYSGISGSAPDPRNFDSANFVDLEPSDGQAITGIGVCGPYLIVFKPRKTFVITDVVTGANRKVSDEVGSISHRSIVDTDKGCFFLSEDRGVMVTDGSSINHISDPVDPILVDARVASATQMQKAPGTYFDGSYYLSVSTSGSANDTLLQYDAVSKSWWRHTQQSNQFALIDPGGSPKLYSADPTDDRVHRAFTPNIFADNDAAYSGGSYFITPHDPFGSPHTGKQIREVRIDGQGDWLTSYALDFTSTFTTADQITWQTPNETGSTFGGSGLYGGAGTFGPAVGISERRYPTLGFCRALSLKLANSDTADWKVFSTLVSTDARAD